MVHENGSEAGGQATHTRKEFLRGGAAMGVMLGAGSLLTGCGSSGGSATSTTTTATKQALRQGGTLRVGVAGGGPQDSMSPFHELSLSDSDRLFAMYESLTTLRYSTTQLETRNLLAEEIAPASKNGDAWTIRVRDGVEFHNGKTLDANDVLYTFQQSQVPSNGSFMIGQWGIFDLAASKTLDKRTLLLKIKTPFAILPEWLCSGSVVGIIPVGFDPKKPVGTGPFKLVSFTPGGQTVFERFDNYWGEKAKVDQLVMVDLTDDTARMNALISGQVDMIEDVPPAQIQILKNNKNIVVQSVPSGEWNPMFVRVDKPPFNDVRVRQALRLALNRPQIVQDAYLGQATPAYDVFGAFDPLSDTSLVRHQDLEQAKSLLKQAGQSDLAATFVVSNIAAGVLQQCTVAVQNWSEAGMRIRLQQVDTGTLYGASYLKWPMSVDNWPAFPYLVLVSSATAQTAAVNETHQAFPRYEALYNEALASLDEGRRRELVHEMQMIDFTQGGYMIPAFPYSVSAWSNKVGGVYPSNLVGVGVATSMLNTVGFVA